MSRVKIWEKFRPSTTLDSFQHVDLKSLRHRNDFFNFHLIQMQYKIFVLCYLKLMFTWSDKSDHGDCLVAKYNFVFYFGNAFLPPPHSLTWYHNCFNSWNLFVREEIFIVQWKNEFSFFKPAHAMWGSVNDIKEKLRRKVRGSECQVLWNPLFSSSQLFLLAETQYAEGRKKSSLS